MKMALLKPTVYIEYSWVCPGCKKFNRTYRSEGLADTIICNWCYLAADKTEKFNVFEIENHDDKESQR
jgi:hypothetical protein